jgi:hypothetical protein
LAGASAVVEDAARTVAAVPGLRVLLVAGYEGSEPAEHQRPEAATLLCLSPGGLEHRRPGNSRPCIVSDEPWLLIEPLSPEPGPRRKTLWAISWPAWCR